VELAGPVRGWLIGGSPVEVYIRDDLPKLSARLLGTDAEEDAVNPDGYQEYVFEVLLAGPSGRLVTVEYETDDGSAEFAGEDPVHSDYLFASGTLVFQPGETRKEVRVKVFDDGIPEEDENFFLELDEATNSVIDDGRAEAKILDDDTQKLSISDPAPILEGDSSIVYLEFLVQLSEQVPFHVAVNYKTEDGSATSFDDKTGNSDYLATTGTLVFEPGQLEERIRVPINPDLIKEGTESFSLKLFDPVNANLDRSQAVGMILEDDTLPKIRPHELRTYRPLPRRSRTDSGD